MTRGSSSLRLPRPFRFSSDSSITTCARSVSVMSSSAHEEGIPSGDRHLQTLTREQLQQRIQQYNSKRERFDVAPTKKQLLSPFTVFCLVLNRTIGSGIFAQPVNILRLTGSAGVAIVVWIAAGLIILCIVASWMELALTIPLHYIFRDGSWQRVSAPRNGGDKNYVSFDMFFFCR